MSRIAIVVVGALSATALGNAAADHHFETSPAGMGGVVLKEPTTLAVAHEDLAIECEERRPFGRAQGDLVCHFVAVYHLVNSGTDDETIQGAFFGYRLRDVAVTLVGPAPVKATAPGRSVRIKLAAAEKRALVAKIGKVADGREESVDLDAIGFRARVPAKSSRELVVSGAMTSTAGYVSRGGYSFFRPDQWTHPFFNEESRVRTETDTEYAIDYLVYPIRTWRRVGPINLKLKWDAGLDLTSQTLAGLDLTGADGEVSTTLDARETAVLDLKLVRKKSTFYEILQPGGPELRLGVRYGGDGRTPLGSIGWDWSLFHYWMQSLSYERGSDGYAAVVPMVLKVNLLVLGFGVGLPQIQGDRQSGVRLQCGLSVPAVAFTYFYDRFPAKGNLPERRQSGLAFVLTI